MASQPYMALYTGDWKKDPDLSLCSVSTRGVWIDLLCSLHDGRIGQVTGTPDQLARLCRCDAAQMHAALLELQATGAANVSERGGTFTVICRRMRKAFEISKNRAEAGSKGGSKAKANREQTPEDEDDSEGGLRRVREFARGEGIAEGDADWFYWKGKGNGWTNGGKPILDWKATLRSWNKAGYLPSQKPKPGQRPTQASVSVSDSKPNYPSPARIPTDAEVARSREIARRETEKLREQFKMPK